MIHTISFYDTLYFLKKKSYTKNKSLTGLDAVRFSSLNEENNNIQILWFLTFTHTQKDVRLVDIENLCTYFVLLN